MSRPRRVHAGHAPRSTRRVALHALAAAAAAAAAPGRVCAATEAPLRLMVAYPPGGVSDEIARALARRLEADLETPVLVEHRPGAGGAIALQQLARAPADGRTLAFCAIAPLTQAREVPLGFDPVRDIAPVAQVMLTPLLLVGTPALEATSFAAMLDVARRRGVRWATSGPGTTGHIVLERVRAAVAGADITHVPYTGGGQQIADALGGQFEVLSSNVGAAQLRFLAAGRLQALAVGAPRRLPVLPQVPTLAELGFAQANLASVFGLFAPGATPRRTVDRLNAAVLRALAAPELRQRLLAVNNLPGGGSADDFAALIARERAGGR